MNEILEQLDGVRRRCEHESCPVLTAVKAEVEAGDWAGALRALTGQKGPCGQTPEGCSQEGWLLRQRLLVDEQDRLKVLWREAFGNKPLEIDFVCVNPMKLRALREAMRVADVVPLTFEMKEHPEGRGDRLRVVVTP